MATSEVEVANQALLEIGEPPINSLTDENTRARHLNRIFAQVRDQVLRMGQWNCATKRATLTQSGTSPAYGYTYQYVLPTDYPCSGDTAAEIFIAEARLTPNLQRREAAYRLDLLRS